MSEVTFAHLVSLEPRLAEARSFRRTRGFCASAVWYGYPGDEPGLKRKLRDLVGWETDRDDLLASREAYDVA